MDIDAFSFPFPFTGDGLAVDKISHIALLLAFSFTLLDGIWGHVCGSCDNLPSFAPSSSTRGWSRNTEKVKLSLILEHTVSI